MSGIIKKALYGGPCDGEEIEIHEDNLKFKPRVTLERDGLRFAYGLDNNGVFVWLPRPDGLKVAGGWFVCDDDGKVISEERSVEDAFRRLDDLNDDSEKWKFKK